MPTKGGMTHFLIFSAEIEGIIKGCFFFVNLIIPLSIGYSKDKMVEVLVKQRVGRTPLVRARRLEKELGFSKIYLKLEGNNPSGHCSDRLAYLIIRDALTRNKKTISMSTYGNLGYSLSDLSKYFDVECKFFVSNKKSIKKIKSLNLDYVDVIDCGTSYAQCVQMSRTMAKKNGWYDANPGFANSVINMYAYSYIAKEIHRQSREPIDTVFCQVFNGSSISGLHLGFKELWINEDIEMLPKLWAVGTTNGNAIIESFRKNKREVLKLDPLQITKTKYSRHMVNGDCSNGQDALNALYDTYGEAVGVTDDELITQGKRFKKLEKIRLSLRNAYPLAAFIKSVEKGTISPGNHIIILDDGKVDLDIRVINKGDLSVSYNAFLHRLDDWLVEFSDPHDEMTEAVENAFEHGYVICAFERDTMVAIAILSRTRFDTFFPKYHLSYIATKKDVKGKGTATQLLQKAIEVTQGDLSLHVETTNPRAIRLYEKMGFRKQYYRMLYKGPIE